MLKERIKSKDKMVGAYVQLSDISISRIIGLSGYDAVWVDTEHSYMSYETLLGHIMAIRTTGTPVVVRAPQNDLTATKKILEMGVDGIIFPMIRSKADADKVIASTLYPPFGDRGFGPMNAIDYGLKNTREYTEASNKELCRFVQIEHKDAIESLDKILENEFIDGFVFGPNDLSGSFGMLGEVFSDTVTKAIKNAINKITSKGKCVIIASGGCSDEVIKHWASFDPDMIFAGADFDFIRDGAVKNRMNLEKYYKNKKRQV